MLVALLIIAIVLAIPIWALVVRLRDGEPTTGGTSFGRQLGRGGADWGPKPTRPTEARESQTSDDRP